MTTQSPAAVLGAVGEFDPPAPTPAAAAQPADEALLARFIRGDRAALGDLAQRYEAPMLGLACGLLSGRRDLARDAVQDTWLRVIKYGRSFKSGSTVKTWLYRILINTCKDTRTRSSRLSMPSTNPERERAGPEQAGPDDPPTSHAHLHQALGTLPGDHRLLILLCYHHGLSHPQAAEVLSIPTGTLKSRLHAALNTLRTHLQNPGGHARASVSQVVSHGPTHKEPTR